MGDEGATSCLNLHQSFFAQRLNGFAHSGAADAELFRKLALGRKLISRLQLSIEDQLLDLFDNLLIKPRKLNS
jgi:hypothetical protein